MKLRFSAIAFVCLISLPIVGHAQVNNQITGSGAPSGSCTSTQTYLDTTGHNLYYCNNNAWSPSQGLGNLTGGGSTTNGAGTNPLGASINVKGFPYSAVGNGKFFTDGAANASNNQLTSSLATFAASDVGQTVACVNNPLSGTATVVINATVATFVSSGTITYSGANVGGSTSNMYCQLTNPADPAAILGAFNACKSTAGVAGQGPTTVQQPACNIYLPFGIYGLSNTLENLISTGNEPCVGVTGDGLMRSILITTATFTAPANNGGWVINDRCHDAMLRDFTIEAASVPRAFTSNIAAIQLHGGNQYLSNVAVFDQCFTGSGTLYGVADFGGVLVQPLVTTSGSCGSPSGGLIIEAAALTDVYSPFLSNTGQNLLITGATSGNNGTSVRVWGGVVDEGSITSVTGSVDVWLNGITLTGGANCLSVDATSIVWMFGGYCGTFATNTGSGPTVASGGQLYMGSVHVRGQNASNYCFGGAGTIFDEGGNSCTLAGGATTYGNGATFVTFPLQTNAITQLGGTQQVSGTQPTSCTITGNGTSTCAFDTGSTNAAGRITIGAAGTTTAVGAVSFNFSPTPIGPNVSSCVANYLSGTGTWATGAIPPIFTSLLNNTVTFNINNAGTNLTAASTYKVAYQCYGM